MKHFLKLAILSWLLFPALSCAAAPAPVEGFAPLRIEKVLPFAGIDQVRIETTLAIPDSAASQTIDLQGKIAVWPQGATLWEGTLGRADVAQGKTATVTKEISGLKPKLWDLNAPNLYNLTITTQGQRGEVLSKTVRFGFRSFETKNGQFLLNGRKIYLRGNAINPPGRGLAPSTKEDLTFARAYVGDLKSRNINLMRMGLDDADVWMDACDELGMLVFQGRYGAAPGGSRYSPPKNFEESLAAYKTNYFERHLRHPAVVINILTNEMPVTAAYIAYLTKVYRALHTWDPNRLYIDNAGFGHGRTGDINDQHPYAGWYNRDFLNYLRYREAPDKVMPITFTETVAAYTGADGRFNIDGKQLAASLTWTGHTAKPVEDSLEYQAFLTGQIIEMNRRLRAVNPTLAGVMPFTHIYFHYQDVDHFEQMGAKPVADQMRISYQPVLLSWEMWTPQVYAGAKIRAIAHIVNDSNGGNDLNGATLRYEIKGKNGVVRVQGNAVLPPVPYYETKSQTVSLALPANMPSGDYELRGNIIRDGKSISTNSIDLYVDSANQRQPAAKPLTSIALYDPNGKTAAALQRLGIPTKKVTSLASLRAGNALVIGEDAWDASLSQQQNALKGLVQGGSHVLLMRQDAEAIQKNMGWLGARLQIESTNTSSSSGMYINPERPDHPVFAGVPRERLRYWSDPTGWDETKKGYPAIMPVRMRFQVARQEDLGRTAILADYGRGLVEGALGEVFDGKGSVLISGFDLIARAGLDPASDRLLRNFISYTNTPAGHFARPLIDSPIVWGDYSTERGLVGGPQYGLLVNVAEKSVPNPLAPALASKATIPLGRRAFGPFSYNGNCHIVDGKPDSPTGSGVFYARIPAGRHWMMTTVQNPSAKAAPMSAELNGQAGETLTVEAGKNVTLRTPIPEGTTEIAVRYSGGKELVLLKTEFE